jgi:hypothetical protein
LHAHKGENSQCDPQSGSRIETEPEEALVGGGDGAGVWFAALKDPVRFSGRSVDFVPPAKTDKASSGDVFEVVKVGGEKEEGDDESENTAKEGVLIHAGLAGNRRDIQFPNEQEPKEVHQKTSCRVYGQIAVRLSNRSRAGSPIRKPRKKSRVMGWALRRQFSSPCCVVGWSMACA